jgi:hypothetical protein
LKKQPQRKLPNATKGKKSEREQKQVTGIRNNAGRSMTRCSTRHCCLRLQENFCRRKFQSSGCSKCNLKKKGTVEKFKEDKCAQNLTGAKQNLRSKFNPGKFKCSKFKR